MIKITDTIAIKADNRSYSICFLKKVKNKKTGVIEDSWKPEFFFTEPEHVFLKMIKLAVADGINDGTWDDVLRRVEDAKATIMRTILPVLANPGASE